MRLELLSSVDKILLTANWNLGLKNLPLRIFLKLIEFTRAKGGWDWVNDKKDELRK